MASPNEIDASLPERASSPVYFNQDRPRNVKVMKAPQQLSRQAVEEFKAIYHKEFGQDISDDVAQEMALRLLHLFDILLQPLPSDTPGPTVIPKANY
jgi:hypothetical protein